MAYSIFDGFAIDENERVVTRAFVTVTQAGELSRLYENRLGTETFDFPSGLLPNPLYTESGRIKFYAQPGQYRVSIVSGNSETSYNLTIPNEITTSVMTPYQNTVVKKNGDRVAGASVLVSKSTGENADLISDATGLPISNPVTTDPNGDFIFRARNGRYNIFVSGPDGYENFYDVLLDSTSNTGGALGGLEIVDSVPVLPVGSFRMVGMVDGGWPSAVSEGALFGVAPSFDFDTETVDHIYQRYNIYDPVEDAEVPSIVVACIIGAYAICYAKSGFAANMVFITPYFADEGVLISVDWGEEFLTVGADVTAISAGAGDTIVSIFPCGVDKFIIVSDPSDTKLYDLKIVTFSSPTGVSVQTVTIDLDELITDSIHDWTYTYAPAFALNQETGQVGVSFFVQVIGPYFGGAVSFRLNASTGSISNISLNLRTADGGAFSRNTDPLAMLSSIQSSSLQAIIGGTGEYTAMASCDGFKVTADGSDKDYTYSEYSSRSIAVVDGSIVTVYSGEGSPTTDTLIAAVATKLTSIGLTVVDDAVFGAPSYYIEYP